MFDFFWGLSILLVGILCSVIFLLFLLRGGKKCIKTDTMSEKSSLFFPLTGKKESDIFFLSEKNRF